MQAYAQVSQPRTINLGQHCKRIYGFYSFYSRSLAFDNTGRPGRRGVRAGPALLYSTRQSTTWVDVGSGLSDCQSQTHFDYRTDRSVRLLLLGCSVFVCDIFTAVLVHFIVLVQEMSFF